MKLINIGFIFQRYVLMIHCKTVMISYFILLMYLAQKKPPFQLAEMNDIWFVSFLPRGPT